MRHYYSGCPSTQIYLPYHSGAALLLVKFIRRIHEAYIHHRPKNTCAAAAACIPSLALERLSQLPDERSHALASIKDDKTMANKRMVSRRLDESEVNYEHANLDTRISVRASGMARTLTALLLHLRD